MNESDIYIYIYIYIRGSYNELGKYCQMGWQ